MTPWLPSRVLDHDRRAARMIDELQSERAVLGKGEGEEGWLRRCAARAGFALCRRCSGDASRTRIATGRPAPLSTSMMPPLFRASTSTSWPPTTVEPAGARAPLLAPLAHPTDDNGRCACAVHQLQTEWARVGKVKVSTGGGAAASAVGAGASAGRAPWQCRGGGNIRRGGGRRTRGVAAAQEAARRRRGPPPPPPGGRRRGRRRVGSSIGRDGCEGGHEGPLRRLRLRGGRRLHLSLGAILLVEPFGLHLLRHHLALSKGRRDRPEDDCATSASSAARASARRAASPRPPRGAPPPRRASPPHARPAPSPPRPWPPPAPSARPRPPPPPARPRRPAPPSRRRARAASARSPPRPSRPPRPPPPRARPPPPPPPLRLDGGLFIGMRLRGLHLRHDRAVAPRLLDPLRLVLLPLGLALRPPLDRRVVLLLHALVAPDLRHKADRSDREGVLDAEAVAVAVVVPRRARPGPRCCGFINVDDAASSSSSSSNASSIARARHPSAPDTICKSSRRSASVASRCDSSVDDAPPEPGVANGKVERARHVGRSGVRRRAAGAIRAARAVVCAARALEPREIPLARHLGELRDRRLAHCLGGLEVAPPARRAHPRSPP